MQVGDALVGLTWLDRARRDVQMVHPRRDRSRPHAGVFITLSADRPNPIGLDDVVVAALDGLHVQVRHMEAVHGTPIVDVKPALAAEVAQRCARL